MFLPLIHIWNGIIQISYVSDRYDNIYTEHNNVKVGLLTWAICITFGYDPSGEVVQFS